MIGNKTVLGLIPARGGSKRVPGKNLRRFNHPEFGKIPLLEIAIRVSKQSKYIDRVIVSSDSTKILRAASKYKSDAVINRPASLATDAARSEDVARHALILYPSDLLVLLQPTSPYRTAADIDACIELATSSHLLAAISYSQETYEKNGAVYVTGPACNYSSKHRRYFMPAAQSLDIDTEADLKRLWARS